LLALAGKAGGAPPLPRQPNPEKVEELKALTGNERFIAVSAAKDDLLKLYASWTEARARKDACLPRWQTLLQFAKHAESLPIIAEVNPQIQAIQENRSLLAEPDPVPPLIATLTDALRKSVQDAAQGVKESYRQGMKSLTDSEIWGQLDLSQRTALLSNAQIVEPVEVQVGTEATLLAVLDSRPLPTWRSRREALPVRFEAARTQAARLLEPKAVKVVPKLATLTTRADLEAYLDDLRDEVQAHLDRGNPVVVSRS